MMRMHSNRRVARVALLVALACLAFFTLSTFSAGMLIGHECAGEDCVVCFCLSVRQHMEEIATVLALVVVCSGLIIAARRFVRRMMALQIASCTLVCLKVKLSD